MAISRRDLFRGRFRTTEEVPAWPEGVDIILDRQRCTAWGKGICTACESICTERAIAFVGLMNPRLLLERCTLCEECVTVCPTAAIRVKRGRKPKQPNSLV